MRAALTREAVVQAAREMIIAEGLPSVSLRRIATALDVTAPALYAYVADKRDLLRAVAETELADLITRFEGVDESDPIERLKAYAYVYIGQARARPQLYPVMFLFPPALAAAPPIGEEIPMATDSFSLPAAAIADAIAADLFVDIDPVEVSLVLFAAMHGMASLLLMGFGFDQATEDALIERSIDTSLSGLLRR